MAEIAFTNVDAASKSSGKEYFELFVQIFTT